MGESTNATNPVKANGTDRIRQEIRQAEADITSTLHDIEERFSPAHIKHEAKEKVRHYSLVSLIKVTDAIKKYPGAAAAIGAGVAFLLVRKAVGHRPRKRSGGIDTTAFVEALPKKVRKDPVKAVKTYITLGRMALAIVPVIKVMLQQMKGGAPPQSRRRREVAELPRAGTFPAAGYERVR